MLEQPKSESKREPEVRMVPVEEISPQGNVRDLKDEELKELVESIRTHGILEPLLAVPNPGGPGNLDPKAKPYNLVFGFRRLRAAKLAGLKAVPVQVREMTRDQVDEARLIENLQRTDLNPLEEALGLQGYLERHKVTQADLGKKIGKSQPYIANRIRLLGLPDRIQASIRGGIITASLGEVLLKIPKEAPKELHADLEKMALRKGADVRELSGNVDFRIRQWKDRLEHEKKVQEWRAKLKFPNCPTCKKPALSEAGYEWGPGTVSCDMYGYGGSNGHFWNCKTGELVKRRERHFDERKQKIVEHRPKVKVARDLAVFFSRATVQQWAQALLNEGKAGILELEFDGHTGLEISGKAPTFPDVAEVGLTPVQLPDGLGGKYLTRVQIGENRSTPSEPDDVVEGGQVKPVREGRAKLLEFQGKKVGVKQATDDLWPRKVDGFSLGERVRIGKKAAWSSYEGKQGVIIAFDRPHADFYSRKLGQGLQAVLDINAAHKRHNLSTLEKVADKEAK